MSEEKHDATEQKKDAAAKDAAKDGAAAKPASGMKALMGPILAVVVLLGGGIGLGAFLSSFFAKPPDTKTEAGHGDTDGHGDGEHADGKQGGDDKGKAHGSLLHTATEMQLNDVVANVKDQGGKTFVKISPSFWVTKETATAIGLSGGGHGGGEVGGEIKRILKARIEEHLKGYELEELTSQAIYKRLEKNLRDIVEREVRGFAPEIPSGSPAVMKVVLGGLVVQR